MRGHGQPHAQAAGPAAGKKSTHAAERGRPDVVAKRAAWFERFAGRRAGDLLFLDEFGSNTKMRRAHGRAAPGERAVARVPHGHYKAISTVAALSVGGVAASSSFDGGTTAARFVAFARDEPRPVLRKGQVLVPELFDAIASATPADARAYIAHCGYATKRRNSL